jgi:hypothetical protein
MKPTVEQTMELFRVCQNLTQMYLPLNLVRLDERTGNVVILAGEEIVIVIDKIGNVDYL